MFFAPPVRESTRRSLDKAADVMHCGFVPDKMDTTLFLRVTGVGLGSFVECSATDTEDWGLLASPTFSNSHYPCFISRRNVEETSKWSDVDSDARRIGRFQTELFFPETRIYEFEKPFVHLSIQEQMCDFSLILVFKNVGACSLTGMGRSRYSCCSIENLWKNRVKLQFKGRTFLPAKSSNMSQATQINSRIRLEATV